MREVLILISKIKLGYKEAYFFQYDSELKILTCPTYYYNLKNFTEEKENRVSAKEIWSKRIRLRLEKKNILQKKLKWLNIRYVGSDITSNWLLCDMFISD